MKITKFLKIKNYRVFRDFSWPSDLPPFARYNLFYGWNGSGKSTLTSIFEALQRKGTLDEGDAIIEIDGTTKVQGAQFPVAVIPPTRVFNRVFISNTLASIKNAKAKPIFYLGQKNVEEAQRLEKKREELATDTAKLTDAISTANNATRVVEKFATDHARNVKTMFSGCRTYLTFDRRRFIEKIKQIKSLKNPLRVLTDEEKSDLQIKQHLQPKSDIRFSSSASAELTSLAQHVCEILSQTVVSTVIAKLANDPPLARWVQEGLALHDGNRHTSTCQFCGNVFSDETRHQYESHFNDAYNQFQNMLQSIFRMIEASLTKLDVIFPADAGFYDNLQDEYKFAVHKTRQTTEKAKSILHIFQKALEQKKSKPFEQIQLEDILRQNGCDLNDMVIIDNELSDNYQLIHSIIQKHNSQTRNIEAEREAAYDKLAKDFLLSTISEYDRLKAAEQSADESRKELQMKCTDLSREISELERRLTESRRPVDELNNELHSYLGRNELSFELEDTGYNLLRSGHLADNLSEGECTAIAFLYFLKTLEDKSFEKDKGIVVIDDPVSSLDDNALFSAFAYMKERVKDCGQLFIMTHNFSFFRQVKNWIFHIKGQKSTNPSRRPGCFYALTCSVCNNSRTAEIRALDTLLLQYESEYHYLFKVLYDVANSKTEEELSNYYNVPNIARRVLESFFAHYVPNKRGELFQKMEGIQYDKAIKTRILRLLNTYSHAAGIADPGHDPTVLSETREIIKELLEMIKTLDESHYNGMISLMTANSTEDDNIEGTI